MSNKFKFSISLNIINHLGINLYSNVPAVISEIVANSWDADATIVEIDIDKDGKEIIITDNGHGMTEDDLNNKFLCVGYRKRDHKEAITPIYKRSVMGRKGIGKLSLFAIAKTIEVHSIKNGEANGLIMNSDDIQKAIQDDDDSDVRVDYNPKIVPDKDISIKIGTQIRLRDIRKNINSTDGYLRTRMARRFSVIGKEYNFVVKINGTEITLEDRDYFKQLQYIWTFGDDSERFASNASNATNKSVLDSTIEINGKKYKFSGWLGTFKEAGQAKAKSGESQNKISILTRGKLALEDILKEFNEAGHYASYLIGEITADFIDVDNEEDIATSSRQSLIEDDQRYIALTSFVRKQLKIIQSEWTGFRNEAGSKIAQTNPIIQEWCDTLQSEDKKRANSLFGKINQMKINEEERNRLFSHAVIAFESSKNNNRLNALEQISTDDLSALTSIFRDFDDVEASLYHQITRDRVNIIKKLKEKVDDNQKEKIIQEYLFEHLWLLDPSWERATGSPLIEERVISAFKSINSKILDKDELRGRLDIRYKTMSGANIIIELKRPSITIDINSLNVQVDKYKHALEKCLDDAGRSNETIEVICVLGKYPSDWKYIEKRDALKVQKIRVVLYDNLIDQAYRAYSEYLEKDVEIGKLNNLLNRLRKQTNL